MYGYGDDREPQRDTVELMEVLVTEHLREILGASMRVAELRGSDTVDAFCIKWTIRKDPLRYNKVDNLMKMNENIKVGPYSILTRDF